MATKTHPYSAALSYATATNGTFTALADVRSVKPPNIQIGSSETTHLGSANAAKEFIPGWIDAGDIGFTLYFDSAQFSTVYGLVRSSRYWKITFPLVGTQTTAATWVAEGFLTSLDTAEMGIDDNAVTAPGTIKVTGKPTFTAAS